MSVVLYPWTCRACGRRWATSVRNDSRPCPFCAEANPYRGVRGAHGLLDRNRVPGQGTFRGRA